MLDGDGEWMLQKKHEIGHYICINVLINYDVNR